MIFTQKHVCKDIRFLGYFHQKKKKKGLASVCLDNMPTIGNFHFFWSLYGFSYSHLSRVYSTQLRSLPEEDTNKNKNKNTWIKI